MRLCTRYFPDARPARFSLVALGWLLATATAFTEAQATLRRRSPRAVSLARDLK